MYLLPAATRAIIEEPNKSLTPPHESWLGEDWNVDLGQTRKALGGMYFDWLIVDHYALDRRWESGMRDQVKNIFVIDDLADRKHSCEVLLDQTYGQQGSSYKQLVPEHCELLIGASYALLRPEFSEYRAKSLTRRVCSSVNNILVSLGGVDKDNITSEVLKVIENSHLPKNIRIIVVLGGGAPNIVTVRNLIPTLKHDVELLVDSSNMAELMSEADLAIGAAGSTSWERCVLGLPTIMFVLDENQQKIAAELSKVGAALILDCEIFSKLGEAIEGLVSNETKLFEMGCAASTVCDGCGVDKIQAILTGKNYL